MSDKIDKILVVDDSLIIREVLCTQIEELGYAADKAENGREAIDKLESDNYDLLILDIIMPIMDGYEVLEYIKNSTALEHIPVIMITDVEEIESVARCIELGAEDYLPKNFNLVILKARLEASLEKKRLRDMEMAYLAKLEEDFISEKQEKERMLQELTIAHNIQQSLLPEKTPDFDDFDIAAINIPAWQVGGDFFDFITVSSRKLGLVIADVSGKGVPAALFMALSRAFIRATAVRDEEPLSPMQHTNSLLLEDADSGMFVTVFYAILDIPSRTISYVNAGHNPPILFHRKAESLEILEAEGIALGVVDEIEFEVKSTSMDDGDVLILYTDGITEAFNPEKDEYGEERLIQIVTENSQRTAAEIIEKVKEDVDSFAGEEPQSDDFTIMVVKCNIQQEPLN